MSVPAVIYGAKSTEDVHGSIPTQLDDCRELAQRHGWDVIGEYSDEAFSAYHGNRGPDLERAKRAAIDAAREHGRAILVAQDADRFARGAGDEPGAADHLGEVYFAMKRQGVELWTVRSGQLDLLRAALEGERATDESARKSQATRAGVERRRSSGKPVGALPGLGYDVEAWIDEHGRPQSRRIVSPSTGPFVVGVFERVADGETPGSVARWLNGEGVRTRRGARFNQATVRKLIRNDAFLGEKGYPRIVGDELAARARSTLFRIDPAELQRRRGGRKPKTPYLLRSVAFCECGAPMYRSEARGHGVTYCCRERLEATGACDRPAIPAVALETHVLNHLERFTGSIEDWIAGKLSERQDEAERRRRRIDADRAALVALEQQRAKRVAEFRELGVTHPAAFEVLDLIDHDIAEHQGRIERAEAALVEWEADRPDVAGIVAFYDSLADAILERVGRSDEVEAVNEALRAVLAGLWCELDDERRIHVRFALRGQPEYRHDELLGVDVPRTLPPAALGYVPLEGLGVDPETVELSTVSACLP